MTNTSDLLIEIGTEELPPKALSKLSAAFSQGIITGLKKAGLVASESISYASPRRLAIHLKDVPIAQADQTQERRGPALKAAYDLEGNPTRAAQGFARGCGVNIADLEQRETPKGTWLYFVKQIAGKQTKQLLADIVQQSLDQLPIPKRMRWGNNQVEFVRPVHWLLMLSNDEVIEGTVLDLSSGNTSRGHRFHHPDEVTINHPSEYANILKTQAKVIADFAERRAIIKQQVQEKAAAIDAQAVISDELLDEVTGLVEWPVAVIGNFDIQFLDVPQEALISAMQGHQKYFPVIDNDGKLMAHFITIANIESKDPSKISEGNERVIRPRFSDAEFFWNQDRSKTLASRRDASKKIVFQHKLGSVFDKTERVANLATVMADKIGADSTHAARAAELSKCDLMTEMVYEFTSLQGVMGRYYAQNDGEADAVANALDEQYMPRYSGDQLPMGEIGQILAIADKVDTLVGIFAIGQKPTGTKDPFALRRAALGVLRIIIECKLDFDLAELLQASANTYANSGVDCKASYQSTLSYIMERLRAYYQEQGISTDSIDAVASLHPTHPLDFEQRIKAVASFRQLAEAESLAAANKRIANILKKVKGDIPTQVNPSYFKEDQEVALHQELSEYAAQAEVLFSDSDYAVALTLLAGLRDTVDNFFDNVMVMDKDEILRNNRLALLNQLRTLFLKVADVSVLQFG
jgi:glycyl-tRNA synthetase beta chain